MRSAGTFGDFYPSHRNVCYTMSSGNLRGSNFAQTFRISTIELRAECCVTHRLANSAAFQCLVVPPRSTPSGLSLSGKILTNPQPEESVCNMRYTSAQSILAAARIKALVFHGLKQSVPYFHFRRASLDKRTTREHSSQAQPGFTI